MFAQIKRLGAETVVYGFSTIFSRLLNFLLVPFYTNVLAPAEYGIVATVYSFIAFLNIFYWYGMESAYFRFAAGKEIGSEKENFSTPFISITLSSLLFSFLLIVFDKQTTAVFQISESFTKIIYYTAGILFFDALNLIPFARLRLARQAKTFAFLKVFNIVFTIGLNLYTILVLRWGIEGIFISNLVASAVTFLMLLPTIVRQFTFSFHKSLYKEILKFALPLIPVGLSGIALNIADRPIMLYLMDEKAVGIYQANYRLGIFMNMLIGVFEYAWRPFFLTHAKDPDAKILFSRILTYFLFICSLVFLLLIFFLQDVIEMKVFGRHLIAPAYWSGLNVVPWVLLGYIFSGIATNLNAGIQIEKKTMYLLPTSLSGSISNILCNFLFIPVFGIVGAAYATTIGYGMVALTLYFVVQRIYYVPYEFQRIGILFLTAACATAIYYVIPLTVALKFALLLLWLASLYVFGFLTKGEIAKIKSLFVKIS